MEKEIEDLIKSANFGSGQGTLNDYSTAWVARIPNKDKSGPEFPESVDYIRRNQMKDGSWGAKMPFFIFDRILSTLISIICLKQWNIVQDKDIISNGIVFVRENMVKLGKFEEIKSELTAGFELIFPTLIDDCKNLGIDFGSEVIIDKYRKEKKRKVEIIGKYEKMLRKEEIAGFGSWYFSLEGIGQNYSNKEIEGMFKEDDLICACYSATAFALIRGVESEKSLEQIRKVVTDNRGAVTSVKQMNIFDLAWSFNFLYFSGYSIKNPILDTHLKSLVSIWEANNGLVGGADLGLPTDADDIANTLLILKLTESLKDIKTLNGLKAFSREDHFITYQGEVTSSLTTNLNCLIALGQFKEDSIFGNISEKVCKWAKNFINGGDEFLFKDKWHLSQFYGMSRALIAFSYHDIEFGKEIFENILKEQNVDGGWGEYESTSLETSYVIIAISYWLRCCKFETEDNENSCLEKAAKYMNFATNDEIPSFWTDKTLYSLINLDKLAVSCAQFALKQLKF